MIGIVPTRQIFLINQAALVSLKLVIKKKMSYNRFLPDNGLPVPNYSNFSGAPINFLRSLSEANVHFIGDPPEQPQPPPGYTSAFPISSYKLMCGHHSKYRDYGISSDPEDYQKTRNAISRDWINVPIRFQKNSAFEKSFKFSVMSFNVLAQELLQQHPDLYCRHNHLALKWEERWKRIHEEISNYRPDIVCLQEVQESHLSEYFLKQLKLLGYCGIYKKRTGFTCDGCAIFYKMKSVSLLEHVTVEFMQPNIPLLDRNNVAIVAVLCPKGLPDSKFVVATTHLLYNPKRQDVRLAQMQILLAEIERLSFHLDSKKQKKYLPIILNGDFNATPTSSLYEFISKGHLKYEHLAAKKLDDKGIPCQGPVLIPSDLQITDNCQHALLVEVRDAYYKTYESNDKDSKHHEYLMGLSKKVDLNKLHRSANNVCSPNCSSVRKENLFSTGALSHLFAFKSAYRHGDPANPQATTFQNEWVMVDYIFYSGKKKNGQFRDDKLKLSGYLRLPYRSELEGFKIPNDSFGSDHFCLVAKFLLNTGP
ncbi:unnamed protein product [Ceutorhynchus assimilis]|uniref:Endonuclease/exonuclease/phosphatase domain-containing protein n=1 Tax=Ceutorhynchus assimilis TaxID=467358 RepID=A0A9N9QI18_9CUCU|nr:unnamed protein product [Ceutorhynchus assimilis]